MADAFNSEHPLSPLWGPNSNDNGGAGLTATIPSANANEVAAFNASQVSLGPDGLHLTAQRAPGVSAGKAYVSGVVISQNLIPGEPGQQGFPITGFRWLPTAGMVWCLEAVIAAPSVTGGGEDPGWWCSTPEWVGEIDLFEMWNYGQQPWGLGVTWIYDTSHGGMAQRTVYGLPAQSDQQFHRWTHVFDGINMVVRVFLDGAERVDLGFPWPTSFVSKPMYLILTHAMRSAFGTTPSWTSGATVMRVRSAAAYTDAPHAGQAMTGGGIAPGTIVR